MATWNELINLHNVPAMIGKLLHERHLWKREKVWNEADAIRKALNELGFIVTDTKGRYIALHRNMKVIFKYD